MHKIQESEQQQPPPIQLSSIQTDLKQRSKLLQKRRKQQWDETCELLTEELHEAWRRRDVKTSFNLMRRLAGSKFDTKKRDWRLTQEALPTLEDRILHIPY